MKKAGENTCFNQTKKQYNLTTAHFYQIDSRASVEDL